MEQRIRVQEVGTGRMNGGRGGQEMGSERISKVEQESGRRREGGLAELGVGLRGREAKRQKGRKEKEKQQRISVGGGGQGERAEAWEEKEEKEQGRSQGSETQSEGSGPATPERAQPWSSPMR